MRPQATAAGISGALATALKAREGDLECLREILGALQTLCYDKATVLPVIDTGALGSVLELLGTQRVLETRNLDLRVLSMAIATNVLAFSGSLLLAREECIDAFRPMMEVFLCAVKSRENVLRAVALAALANACAHPALAGRAVELGAPDALRYLLEPRQPRMYRRDGLLISSIVETAIARAAPPPAVGVVEEGAGGDGGLPFYSFKWGVHNSLPKWVPDPGLCLRWGSRMKLCGMRRGLILSGVFVVAFLWVNIFERVERLERSIFQPILKAAPL
ncbi:unnamed protein product [Ectocarpus fasciculatus]